MTREALLKTAIRDYQDKEHKARLIPFKRFVDNSGYSYILKQEKKAKSIFCAIHFNVSWEQNERLGNLRQISVEVSTREKLTTDCLIEYLDLIIFVKSYSGYNETMKQYMYEGTSITADQLILLEEPTKTYGNTCYDKLIEFDKYTIVPKYLSKNDWLDKTILCDVQSSRTFNLATYEDTGDQNRIWQMREDEVEFSFVNFTREEILVFQYDLADFSINYHLVGFLTLPEVRDEPKIDSNALTKTILTTIKVNLCYNLEIKKDLNLKYIKNSIYRMEKIDGID